MMSTATAACWPFRGVSLDKKARRAVAAQVGHDHAVAGRRQQRRDVDEAVDVVGPAVQEDDRRAVGRTGFGVPDVQHAGVDLLQRAEGGVRARLDRRWKLVLRLRSADAGTPSCAAAMRHGGGAEEAGGVVVDLVGDH